MLKIYRKLYDILDSGERRLTLLIFALVVVVACLEVAGVASILPFMSVLGNPDVVDSNPYLNAFYNLLGFQTRQAFIFFLGVLFLSLMFASLAIQALSFWMFARFSHMRNHALACRLVAGYLHQPYEWFLHQHGGALGATILNEVHRAVHGVLFPALQIIARGFVVLLLIVLMLIVDPTLALSVAFVLASAYGLIFLVVRGYLRRIGQDRRNANEHRYKVTQEAFEGIKVIKVSGLESAFLDRFYGPSLRVARREVAAQLVSELPSFIMQAIIFGGVMLVLLYLLATRGGFQEALSIFSLYMLAGYRMMPALQQIYRDVSNIRFYSPALDAVHQDLQAVSREETVALDGEQAVSGRSALGLRDALRLVGVTYRYPGSEKPALREIDLSIQAGTTVGFVGPTGSGKTTLVDVLLGLLHPEAGELIVDGQTVTGFGLLSWRHSIGYVPQQIYLSDDTIAANIAFGVPQAGIDRRAVERAARIANVHDFVTNELPDGYDSMVGERGVRLSGGQRQRIGIARAIYQDPDVLIMDEATSGLDNLTERAVMDALQNLGGDKTIVLIAHRLSTVRQCDQVFYLEQGKIVAVGTYDELLAQSEQFHLLALGAANHENNSVE